MRRLFDEHIKRQVTFLDGAWLFTTDAENKGEELGFQNGLQNAKSVIVPSAWNSQIDLYGYEGVCWYQKEFYFDGTARIVFEGVMTECKVWLDGKYLGYHYGGFCQFDFIVPDLSKGNHTLVVKVDNSFDEHSIPQKDVDWYHFGGITRSVSVEKLQGVAITYQKIDYALNQDRTEAQISFTVELYGADKKKETALTVTLDGETLFSKTLSLRKGSRHIIVSDKIKVTNLKLWDTASPYLYTVAFSTDTDDIIDKIGFRTIEVKDCKLLLNGKSIELRGVNRHEDHPEFGMTVPAAIMERDLEIIADMGCNAIRGSHYPNSRIFLDMLDEKGFLFYSEIPIWGCGFKEATLGDTLVLKRGLEMHKEMVRHYYNHPSIILWGMHNEIKTDTDNAFIMSKLYYTFLKENGGNRLVTYATCKPNVDNCFEFCDIISINQYFGWYYGTREDWKLFPDKFDRRRRELGFGDKPVIMSEFGAAANYGTHTFSDVKWTEEYQAKLHEIALQTFHDCPYMIGSFIWQFCDTASDKDMMKVKSLNNKGLLSAYREPKQAYFTAKEKYLKFKKEAENNG
ncbi:MAG: hypothetical protein IJ946_03220 [Clostridia bacterium]|nr:hypothetical protein [Clostridia bacterium]